MIRYWMFAAMCIGVLGGRVHASTPSHASFIVVPGHAQLFEISVHEDVVTTLIFPCHIQDLLAYNHAGLELIRSANHIAVSISAEEARSVSASSFFANIVVTCEDFQTAVSLHRASQPEDALTTALFHAKSIEDLVREGVARNIAEYRRDADERLAEKERQLNSTAESMAWEIIVNSLHRRHIDREIFFGARTDDQVVVKAKRITWIGNDAYFGIVIVNNSKRPFRVARAFFQVQGQRHEALSSWEDVTEDTLLATVPADAHLRGTVCLRNAAQWLNDGGKKSRDHVVTLILAEEVPNPRELQLDIEIVR